MSRCSICLEESWNLPKLPCCGQTCHKKCIKRWKRTLIEAAQGCPLCRTPFVNPFDNETRTMLEGFMREVTPVSMLIAKQDLCRSQTCATCIYWTKTKTSFQRYEIAKWMVKALFCACFQGKPCNLARSHYMHKIVSIYFNQQ